MAQVSQAANSITPMDFEPTWCGSVRSSTAMTMTKIPFVTNWM
jgi:hypothetical protein